MASEADGRVRQALRAGRFGAWRFEFALGLGTASERTWEIFGRPGQATIAIEEWTAAIHPDDREAAAEAFARTAQGDAPFDLEYRLLRPDGAIRWVAVTGELTRDAAGNPASLDGVIADVTARKAAEAVAARARARAEALAVAMDALTAAGPDPDAVLRTVARLAATRLGDMAVVRLLSADGQWLLPAAVDHPDPAARAVAQEALHDERHPADEGAIGAALRTGQPQRLAGEALVERRAADPHLWPAAARLPTAVLLAAPMRADGRAIGTLSVSRGAADRAYDEEDERFLQELADRAGLAIERARLFAQVRASEERLRLATESNRMVAWEWDPAANRITTSANFPQVYGLPALTGVEEGFALVWPEDLPAHRERVLQVAREGGAYRSEFRVTRPVDGQTVWLEERASALTVDDGRVVRVVGVAADITERKRAEEALRASEARFRALASATATAIWTIDPTGDLLEAPTARWPFLTDLPAEALASEWLAAVHPDDREPGNAIWWAAIAASRPFEFEQRVRQRDGSYRHFSVRAAPVHAADGTIREWVGADVDVTERKRAEEALRASEARQAFLLRLNDALRPLADPAAIQAEASRLLGEHLGTDRTYYVEIDDARGLAVVARDYVREGAPSLAGGHPLVFFSAVLEPMREGRPFVAADVVTDPFISDADRPAYLDRALRAFVCVPLIKAGQLVAAMCVTNASPHAWSPADVAQLQEVAERTWEAAERARAEAALRESEERLQLALDATEMGTFIWHVAEDRGEPDAQMLALFGQPPDGTLTLETALATMIHPDDGERYAAAVAMAADPAGSGALREDVRVLLPDGSLRWLAITGKVSFAGTPRQPTRMAGAAIDVTTRKTAEEALRDQSEITRTIADNATRALFLLDPERHCTYMNPVAEQMTGYPFAELQGRTVHDLIHFARPDGSPYPAAECPIAQASLQQRYTQGEEVFIHKDGHFYPVAFSASPILRDGAPAGTVVEVEGLSERRRREATIQRQAQLIELSHEPIFVRDAADVIVEWNAGAEQLYGYGKAEAIGQVSHRLLQSAHPVPLADLAAELRQRGEWTGEVRHRAKDGREVVVESRQQALTIGGRWLVLESNRDVTERTRLQEERAAFLDALAHDVKNPLGVIKGQAQLLRRRLRRGTEEPDRLEAGLAGIEEAVADAAALVDELLDVAHLRAGRPLELRLNSVDLVALATAAVEEIRQRTARHRVRVVADEPALRGEWDEGRLERVLANLLGNAVKYSPGGGEIVVRVGRAEEGSAAWAVLAVSDQGVGIPEADLPRIFERFQRGGNVEAIGGTGIGLAGARQIVTQHGGTLSVASVVGEGSTFTVRLPLGSR